MTELLNNPRRLPSLTPLPEDESILAPAFRQENDMRALWDLARTTRAPVDPDLHDFQVNAVTVRGNRDGHLAAEPVGPADGAD